MKIEFRTNLLAGLALSLLISGVAEAQSLTMQVNSTADQPDQYPGDGMCQTLYQTCTLRAAIQEANAYWGAGPHTILVPPGTYTLAGLSGDDNNASGDLDIRSNVNLSGAGAGVTILRGAGSDRVVDIEKGATVKIYGITITGGVLYDAATGGAGIRNAGNLTLQNCAVQANGMGAHVYDDGGGIYNKAPSATDPPASLNVYNTVVTGNNANHGAGIYNGGILNLADSKISANTGTLGGGISDSTAGATTVNRSTISGNTATSSGGGLYITGTVTLSNCTVSGNVAKLGAAGALYLASKSAQIGSCTFNGNTVGTDPIYQKNLSAMYVNSGTVSIRATIFNEWWYNKETGVTTDDVACKRNLGIISSQGYNIDRGNSCQFAYTADRVNIDPKLDPNLANNGGPTLTHALLAGSPAIDAIPYYMLASTSGLLPPTDQRGIARPQVKYNTAFTYTAWVVDIGAVEYVYPTTLSLF
jgi:CSLREA domain-containing protein